MKGLVFLGDRQAEVRQFPDPKPGPGQAVVRIQAGGLCGSDLHRYRHTAKELTGDEKIPGHEPCGVVEEIGPGVSNVQVGDRVSVYHYLGCGTCLHCLAGELNHCSQRQGFGGPIHGSCAELILTDARNCLPLPPELSYAVGAMMACNAGTAFSAMLKLRPSGLDTVAIFGQGPVGLAGTIFAKGFGAHVIAVEPIAERRQLALDLGADEAIDPTDGDVVVAIHDLTHGEGANGIFETSGSTPGREGAVASLCVGGRGVFVGFGSQDKTVNLSQIISRQLTLIGSFVLSIPQYFEMARFIIDRKLPLEAMITHRFSIDDAPEAFALFDNGKTGKVILEQG